MPSPPPESRNLFRLPGELPPEELVDALARSEGVVVERIVSTGQATAPGEWLAGESDEWVVLLTGEAELAYEDGSRLRLEAGDWVLIPAGERHRVESTSADPPCVWLAVHASGLRPLGKPARCRAVRDEPPSRPRFRATSSYAPSSAPAGTSPSSRPAVA